MWSCIPYFTSPRKKILKSSTFIFFFLWGRCWASYYQPLRLLSRPAPSRSCRCRTHPRAPGPWPRPGPGSRQGLLAPLYLLDQGGPCETARGILAARDTGLSGIQGSIGQRRGLALLDGCSHKKAICNPAEYPEPADRGV